MKLGNPPNYYYVRVSSDAWSLPLEEASLYDGTYRVDLNRVLKVTFVDGLSRFGPPWTAGALPAPGAELRDPALVRLNTLLNGRYVVTPNDALAGRAERFDWPWGEPGERYVVVFYVSTQTFTELRDDLEALLDVAGNVHSTASRDDLLDHPVIQFIEDHVLTSTWLRPIDARTIGRAPA
jgi:hypothetical protein